MTGAGAASTTTASGETIRTSGGGILGATVEEQSVHLELDYPDVGRDLNRWMPLVKWLLAVPNYIVLAVLAILRLRRRCRTMGAARAGVRLPAGDGPLSAVQHHLKTAGSSMEAGTIATEPDELPGPLPAGR